RVGVLYDLLGRDSHHDKRDETVRQFIKRYHVDTRQSERVKRAALQFFSQLGLPDGPEKEELERTLRWAADLHESGISIAHADYHKHSAYILQHADMPGFSRDDQILLSMFALGHQGKIAKLQTREPTRAKWLALLCLRLAVLLSRRRDDHETLPITILANGKSIRVSADSSWLANHPLSEFSLQSEKRDWNKAGFNFEIVENRSSGES